MTSEKLPYGHLMPERSTRRERTGGPLGSLVGVLGAAAVFVSAVVLAMIVQNIGHEMGNIRAKVERDHDEMAKLQEKVATLTTKAEKDQEEVLSLRERIVVLETQSPEGGQSGHVGEADTGGQNNNATVGGLAHRRSKRDSPNWVRLPSGSGCCQNQLGRDGRDGRGGMAGAPGLKGEPGQKGDIGPPGEPDEVGNVSRRGESEENPAMSCREIFLSGSYTSGLYWVRLSARDEGAVQVWCEMGFQDGGWLRIFNMMAKGASTDQAAEMYDIITRNGPIQAVLSNTTSGAIYTQGLDLGMYHEVVYGWAKSSADVVSHYGYYRDDLGLKGHCYIDGFCGDNKVVATMTSSVTKEKKEIKTGNDPNYPHVGLGWTGQQITWGYDLNTSPHGHWANWYTSSCCLTGNTADIRDAGSNWRYSILIR